MNRPEKKDAGERLITFPPPLSLPSGGDGRKLPEMDRLKPFPGTEPAISSLSAPIPAGKWMNT